MENIGIKEVNSVNEAAGRNELLNGLLTRRSIRKYKPDPVPEELVEEIVKAGTYAASGMGQQSPLILAVTNREIRDRLSKENAKILGNPGSDPFYGAPAVLVVLADKRCSTHLYDGSLVMGNMMLAAHSMGLGSCWIHRAREVFEGEYGKSLLEHLGIDGEYEGIGNCVVGYPAEPSRPAAPRKESYVYHIK